MGFMLMLLFTRPFPAAAELIPVDESPLGERIPLVLIHGIRPSKDKQYDWQLFLKRADADPVFSERYKPYLFIYKPSALVADNAQSLHTALDDYKKRHPDTRHFQFVAQSLGGIILREALNDPQLWTQTDRVIAIGTPFHGSPLTNSDWMRARLKQSGLLSQFRQLHRISYWLFGRMFPNYKDDLCWDNFNGQMPEDLVKKHTCQARQSVHTPQEEMQKYVTYAGFFGETEEKRHLLGDFLGIPRERAGKKSTSPWTLHLISYLIRPDIAYVPLKSDAGDKSKSSLMWYNDGVSPITSQLWLGLYLQTAQQPIPREEEWQALRSLQGSENARLFEGLDHGDWLKGTSRYRNPDGKLLDWLHPDQPARDVNAWILLDLMR